MLYLQTNFSPMRVICDEWKAGSAKLWTAYFIVSSIGKPSSRFCKRRIAPAFFTEDNRLSISGGAFNWPPMWMSRRQARCWRSVRRGLKNYLAEFERKAEGLADLYQQRPFRDFTTFINALVSATIGDTGRSPGRNVRETLSRAMTNSAPIVHIVTWN